MICVLNDKFYVPFPRCPSIKSKVSGSDQASKFTDIQRIIDQGYILVCDWWGFSRYCEERRNLKEAGIIRD